MAGAETHLPLPSEETHLPLPIALNKLLQQSHLPLPIDDLNKLLLALRPQIPHAPTASCSCFLFEPLSPPLPRGCGRGVGEGGKVGGGGGDMPLPPAGNSAGNIR